MRYRWSDLLKKYLENKITETERNELYRQATSSKAKQAQVDGFVTKKGIISQIRDLAEIDPAQHYESFKKQLKLIRQRQVYRSRTIAVAGLVPILSIFISLWLIRQPHSIASHQPSFSMKNFSVKKEPIFILSNGSTIKLDSVPDGAFIAPGIPFKKKESTLVYVQIEPEDQAQTQGINILSVPPGRRYQITLADGSVIMLNASSQLHFPVNFSTNARWVAMEGEAWFEVNANPAKPFFVNVRNQLITKVTGTSFNIKAYENDYINTTLIKGHLAITNISSKQSDLLHAGQQASFRNGSFVKYDSLKMDQVIAWKKDEFIFNNNSIEEVMKEIGRWYNVKIKYKGDKPAKTITGVLPRSEPLSATINIISAYYKTHIDKNNDTLIVSP